MMFASSTGTEGSTKETSEDVADPFSDRKPPSVRLHSINSIFMSCIRLQDPTDTCGLLFVSQPNLSLKRFYVN